MTEIDRLAAVLHGLRTNYPEWITPAIKARVEMEVRAVLQAMREPSRGMLEGATIGVNEWVGPEEFEPMWRAGIDHILAGGE